MKLNQSGYAKLIEGAARLCDEHGADVPEHPRAAPLRALIELLEKGQRR